MGAAGGASARGTWRRQGEGWLVGLGGRETFMRGAKGLEHLAILLARPGEEVGALDLVAAVEGTAPAAAPTEGLEAGVPGDAGPALDAEAKAAYRRRLEEARDEICEAERFGDPERAARARIEFEFLAKELSSAMGLGGRDRPTGSPAERARVNVTRAIRASIERIAQHDAPLADHLQTAVKTGTFCSYAPRPDALVRWDFDGRPAAAVPAPAPAAAGDAQQPVVVVFSDIEDSVAMLERAGDEAWLELLGTHNAIVREQLARHGGTEVKTAGDGFMLTFADVRDALWCAVDVQRALHGLRARGLRVRIGLHAGDALREGSDLFGRTVVVAARVSGLARGDEILATAAVRELAADVADVAFGPARTVALKGLRGRHEVHEVLWQDAAAGGAAAPGRPARLAPELLERELELAGVDELLAGAAEGAGGCLLLQGPAGIGKSALVLAAASHAAEAGFLVLRATGAELERTFAFGVVRQLFEPAARALPAERREQVMRGAVVPAAAMLNLTDEAPPAAAATEDGSLPFDVLNGLYWLALALAEERPLALLVDDAHWTDAPSLGWLAFMASRVADTRIALLVAGRPAPELAGLEDISAVEVLSPAPLGVDAVESVVRAAWPEASTGFCRACHVASAGNPFYLREIVAAARAEGIEPTDQGAERLRNVTPDSVARAVSSRLRRLPPEARALAQAAALLVPRAELELAAELAQLPPDAAAPAADALVAAEIMHARRPLQFTHPIIRAVVEHHAPLGARAELHARAADLLTRRGAPADEVAAHLLQAPGRGSDDSVRVLREAARSATAGGDPASAARLLERALAEPAGADERAAVLFEHARALEACARFDEAEAALARALETAPEDRLRAEIVLGLARLQRSLPVEQRVATLDEAASAVADSDVDLRFRLEAAALELLGDAVQQSPSPRLRQEYTARLARGAEAATGVTPGERQLMAIFVVSRLVRAEIAADEARALVLQALDDGELVRRLAAGAWSCDSAIEALSLVDAFDLADRHARDAERLSRRHGTVAAQGYAAMLRGVVALHRGALPEVDALLRSVYEIGRQAGDPYVSYQAEQLRVSAALERGDLATSQRACDAIAEAAMSPLGVPLARGRVLAARGQHALAVADLRAAYELRRSTGTWRSVVMGSPAPDLVFSLLAMGDVETARTVARDELRLARRVGAPSSLATALRALAHAEGGTARRALLAEAVELLAGSQAALVRARVLLDHGLAERDSGADGAAALEEALGLAHGCDATVLEGEIRAHLDAAGGTAGRLRRPDAGRLAPTERRVVELAADGASDLEIAQALFTNVRAVEDELRAALRKLGLSDRSQLRDAAGAALTAS